MSSKDRIYQAGRVVLSSPVAVLGYVKKPRTAWHQGEQVDLAGLSESSAPAISASWSWSG